MENDTITILENNLFNNLRPVQPSPDFIVNLGNRLLSKKNIQLENPRNGLAFLFVSLGLFVGVLLIWLFKRIDPA